MRALRKEQASIFNFTQDIRVEARIVERAFGLGCRPSRGGRCLLGEISFSNLLTCLKA